MIFVHWHPDIAVKPLECVIDSGGSVDDTPRPQISCVRAARRPEEVLPAALHRAVEGAPIREEEMRQPRRPRDLRASQHEGRS